MKKIWVRAVGSYFLAALVQESLDAFYGIKFRSDSLIMSVFAFVIFLLITCYYIISHWILMYRAAHKNKEESQSEFLDENID